VWLRARIIQRALCSLCLVLYALRSLVVMRGIAGAVNARRVVCRLDCRAPDGSLTGKSTKEPGMVTSATTTMSTKGQVVIPEEIREQLGLEPGTQFIVVAERDVVVLKTLTPPAMSEFTALLTRARAVAKATNLTRGDIQKAITKVRRRP
jgi:AbrB family looped-hinge helix DNA binding protein